MMKEEPGVIELKWSREPLMDDAFKFRWLNQYALNKSMASGKAG
jgi:hypothetical protein